MAQLEGERDEANRLRKELADMTDRMLTTEAALGEVADECNRLAGVAKTATATTGSGLTSTATKRRSLTWW